MNLNRRWRFTSGSVDVVYASHVFEHLTLRTSGLFMSEAMRVLRLRGAHGGRHPGDLLRGAEAFLTPAAGRSCGHQLFFTRSPSVVRCASLSCPGIASASAGTFTSSGK